MEIRINRKEIAERMMIKVRLINDFAYEYENIREYPFYSELKGMEQTLKMMGIEFEYDFTEDYKIKSVTIDGYTAIA